MSGFYIRRRKEHVLKELPDKYYTDIEVDLSPQQARAYESMRRDMIAWVGEHEHEAVATSEVIAQLVRLQQFACAYGEMVETKIRSRDTGEETTVQKLKLTEPSTKIDAVIEIIRNNPPNKQFVIFSQFSQVIKILEKRLADAGISYGIYIGETPADERSRIIDDFQNGLIQIFASTISAGGVGITLTASDTAIFIDRSWSPSINRQAEDRLHRITQKNAVHVIDILAKQTIDAKRIQQILQKWSWIRQLIGDDRDNWVVD